MKLLLFLLLWLVILALPMIVGAPLMFGLPVSASYWAMGVWVILAGGLSWMGVRGR